VLDKFNGKPIDFSLNFWIMRNILEALETVQS
jgi:hypothetical protein